MDTLRPIVVKELKEIFRQRIFQILGGILLVLSVAAMLVSFAYQKSITRQIDAANQTARTHWESQSDKNQHSAAHYGVYLFKPKSSFSFWDPGIEKFVGSAIFIEPHGRNRPKYKPIEDSPMLARSGELTPSFVFLLLLPLFIICISCGAISGEKEAQTLNFALSQGVSMRKFIFAKVLARWVIVLMLTLPLFVAMALVLHHTAGNVQLEVLRWVMLFLVYMGFFGVFIHLSVGISALVGKTTSAMAIMIGFWLLTAYGVPRLAAFAGTVLHPVESASAFDRAIESEIDARGIRRHDSNSENLKAFQQDLLRAYAVEKLEDLPVNYAGLSLLEAERRNDIVIDEGYERLFDAYTKQVSTVQYLGVISPFLSAQQLSMGICQTDMSNFIHFQKEADTYRKAFNVTLNNDLVASDLNSNVRDRSFWREVPAFEYTALSFAAVSREYWISLLILLFWFVASTAFLFTTRYKKN